jgi:hypothetical protein
MSFHSLYHSRRVTKPAAASKRSVVLTFVKWILEAEILEHLIG